MYRLCHEMDKRERITMKKILKSGILYYVAAICFLAAAIGSYTIKDRTMLVVSIVMVIACIYFGIRSNKNH